MSRVTSTITRTMADSDGWIEAGALTTTFTPPAGCDKILSTTSSSLAFLGTDYFNQESCYPSVRDPLIRAYFRPGLVCPSGWTSELVYGSTRTGPITDTRLVLPLLQPNETVAQNTKSASVAWLEQEARRSAGCSAMTLAEAFLSATTKPKMAWMCHAGF